jgi:hypothetical protein
MRMVIDEFTLTYPGIKNVEHEYFYAVHGADDATRQGYLSAPCPGPRVLRNRPDSEFKCLPPSRIPVITMSPQNPPQHAPARPRIPRKSSREVEWQGLAVSQWAISNHQVA